MTNSVVCFYLITTTKKINNNNNILKYLTIFIERMLYHNIPTNVHLYICIFVYLYIFVEIKNGS